ncbi:MAG: PBSX family phage terminase large subunit [Deltaproteobacteria bacterium]|nr:PBSX family phage terminase large subunit [Deltaproteobacteria bacterium]
MSNIVLQGTPIFYQNQAATTQTVINRGGARSSKSWSIMQHFVYKFLTEKNKSFFLLRKTLPSLRMSTLRDFRTMLDIFGVRKRVHENKMELNYEYNGNLLHFGSLDDPEKVKSTEWNYIWMEEATEFTQADYNQLKLRLSAKQESHLRNQIYLSFNPVDEFHWIKEELIDSGLDDITEIVSTYLDNPFLSDDYIKTLKDLAAIDANFHRIYALGQWGRLDHLIFDNWKVVDEMPENPDYVYYGLDFGFNNPSAMIEIAEKDQVLYLDEKIHQSHLTNSDLIQMMKEPGMIQGKSSLIYADSAEPQRIEEINRAGYVGCTQAHKSVNDGIDHLKSREIRITKRSETLIKEFKAYSWRTDKQGRVLDDPVKFADHGVDASRYGAYTHAIEYGGQVGVKWL